MVGADVVKEFLEELQALEARRARAAAQRRRYIRKAAENLGVDPDQALQELESGDAPTR
jgi:hypothetical protein